MTRLNVTRDELVAVLRGHLAKASFCTLMSRTMPVMNKTIGRRTPNPYYGRTFKVAKVHGIINWRYESAVNRQRERENKEPDFEALPRSWGQRLEGQPFVEYEGRLYLEIKVQMILEHYYETLDGLRLDLSHVESFLPQRRPQSRQGLNKEVVLRDYAIDSVVELHAYGNEYVIVQDA